MRLRKRAPSGKPLLSGRYNLRARQGVHDWRLTRRQRKALRWEHDADRATAKGAQGRKPQGSKEALQAERNVEGARARLEGEVAALRASLAARQQKQEKAALAAESARASGALAQSDLKETLGELVRASHQLPAHEAIVSIVMRNCL
jgi:hypothetical protein